jgi:hypothetical protein
MKWLLIALGLGLVGGFVYWQMHTVKTAYVNGLPAYRDLPNHEYVFEQECYIFKFKDHATDWPLVGTHLVVPDLPETVTSANVGADLPKVRILGLAHIGERFKLVSVRRDTNRKGQTITFEVLFLDEAAHPYARLDTFWIMNHAPEARGLAPTLRPDFAVPSTRQ